MGTKESWEILQEAIPRGKRAMLADMLSVCPDLICKWGREPLGDENLSGTGARNPIDRVEVIYSFLKAYNPEQAKLIPQYFAELAGGVFVPLKESVSKKIDIPKAINSVFKEVSDVVQAVIKAYEDKHVTKEEAKVIIKECDEAIVSLQSIRNMAKSKDGK